MTEIFVASINGICIVIAALIGRGTPFFSSQTSRNYTKRKSIFFWIGTFSSSLIIGVFTYVAFGWVIDDKKVTPIEVPKGFNSVSWAAGELGIAVPEKWWIEPNPSVLTFNSPITEQRFSIWVHQSDTVSIRKLEANYKEGFEKFANALKQFFPMLNIKGNVVLRPHQGFSGFAATAAINPPDGQLFEFILQVILDEKRQRILIVMYSQDPISDQIMSTLNLR